jgi:hypothetical protein
MMRRIAFLAGLYALLGGIASLAGWVLDVQRLTDWDNNGISIQPNATLCVIVSGLAVLALATNRLRVTAICGALVLSVGGMTLLQWVSGLSFGIDSLLMFGREWGRVGVVTPGRMGLPVRTGAGDVGAVAGRFRHRAVAGERARRDARRHHRGA